jgi:hypothetical protein
VNSKAKREVNLVLKSCYYRINKQAFLKEKTSNKYLLRAVFSVVTAATFAFCELFPLNFAVLFTCKGSRPFQTANVTYLSNKLKIFFTLAGY